MLSAESEWFTRGHLRTHYGRWPLYYRHASSGTGVSHYSEFMVSGCVERRRPMDEDVSQRATLGGLRQSRAFDATLAAFATASGLGPSREAAGALTLG